MNFLNNSNTLPLHRNSSDGSMSKLVCTGEYWNLIQHHQNYEEYTILCRFCEQHDSKNTHTWRLCLLLVYLQTYEMPFAGTTSAVLIVCSHAVSCKRLLLTESHSFMNFVFFLCARLFATSVSVHFVRLPLNDRHRLVSTRFQCLVEIYQLNVSVESVTSLLFLRVI